MIPQPWRAGRNIMFWPEISLYPEFMDKALVTPAILEQIVGDDDGIMDRF